MLTYHLQNIQGSVFIYILYPGSCFYPSVCPFFQMVWKRCQYPSFFQFYNRKNSALPFMPLTSLDRFKKFRINWNRNFLRNHGLNVQPINTVIVTRIHQNYLAEFWFNSHTGTEYSLRVDFILITFFGESNDFVVSESNLSVTGAFVIPEIKVPLKFLYLYWITLPATIKLWLVWFCPSDYPNGQEAQIPVDPKGLRFNDVVRESIRNLS